MGRNTNGWGQRRRSDNAAPLQRRALVAHASTNRPMAASVQASPATSRHIAHHAKRTKRHIHTVVWPKMRRYATIVFLLYLAVLCAGVLDLLQMRQAHDSYQLSAATQKLLGAAVSNNLAGKITYNGQKQQYLFNANFKADSNAIKVGGGQYSATLGQDIQKDGFSLTDPASNITVTLKPTFTTMPGKNQSGRLIYPLNQAGDQMVYSVRGNGLKEDIVLPAYQGDSAQFGYTLDLPAGTEARMLPNGGVGIYSSDPTLFGNITYGSDKDRALVDKARANGAKNNLVFGIPAPIIKDATGVSKATAKFVLKGNSLTVEASALKQANYPLTIDPSVVVTGSTDFQGGNSTTQGNTSLAGNDDGNIDFSTGGQIAQNALTAGTTGTFNAGNTLTANFAAGSVAYNGYLYLVGGHSTSAYVSTVQSASISSGAPGAWNTSANTSAPGWSIRGFSSAVAYNGYIYIMGGNNGSTVYNEVWYALLCTANNSGKGGCAGTAGTIGTWASTTAFGSGSTNTRYNLGAVAYQGYMYVFGGCPSMSAGQCSQSSQLSTTETAPINADGTLGAWNTSTTALPAGRFGFGYTMYNGYVYILGGCTVMGLGSCSTANNDTIYAKLSSGSIGTWATTSAFSGTRSLTTAVAASGYLYVLGGQLSNTWLSDVQYAPINADGTVGAWTTTNTLTSTRASNGIAAYTSGGNTYIYASGGCAASACISSGTNVRTDSDYAQISTPDGTNTLNARVTGTALPAINSQGTYAAGAVALNGYLYVVGGCINSAGSFTDATCNNSGTTGNDTTGNTRYVPINADGSLGAWTTDSTHLVATNGLAAMGIAAFENTIFVVGGVSVTGFGGTTTWLTTGEYVSVNPSTGALTGNWTTVNNVLPLLNSTGYGGMGAIYNNGYLYSFGGCNAAGGLGCSNYSSVVCRVQISSTNTIPAGANSANPSCSAASQTAMPLGLGLMGFTYGGGYVYLLGGSSATNNQNIAIYYAALTNGGITGSWNTATGTLPFSGGSSPNINGDRRAPAVYSNGHIFVLGGHNGGTGTNGTALASIYDCTITPSTGNIASNCATSTQTLSISGGGVVGKWNSSAVVANGYIYDVGGCYGSSSSYPPINCSAASQAVDIFRINYGGVGAANGWTSGTGTLSAAVYTPAMTAYNGHLYAIGGCTDTGNACTARSSAVNIGTINNDPGAARVSWASGTAIGVARGAAAAYVLNGYIYVVGGYSGAILDNYEYAKLASNGSIQSVGIPSCASAGGGGVDWCLVTSAANGASAVLPSARTTFAGFTAGNNLYVVGGLNGSAQNTTYIGTPNATNGLLSWATASNNFTTGRDAEGATSYNGYMYVAGGFDGTNYLQDVQFAQIQSDGTPGTWNYTAGLPQRVDKLNLYAADGFMFYAGGEQSGGATCNSHAWSSSIASNGQLHTFEQNVNAFSTARGYAGGVYYDGYVYIAGGNCGAGAPTNSVVYGGILAQPEVALFSQELDTGLDTNPINLYIQTTKGSTAGSVANSQINLAYMSAPSSGAVFGTLTKLFNLSDATTVYSLSALNGSGAVIDGNRYYLLMFTIDDSQSFSFPDATAQETAITAYEMYYHPNSGARLRNGSTFSNQIRQSLDAHP